MKIQKFLLITLGALVFNISGMNSFLERPHQDRIAHCIEDIQSEERELTIKRYVFLGTLLTAGCYVSYKMFFSTPEIPKFSESDLIAMKACIEGLAASNKIAADVVRQNLLATTTIWSRSFNWIKTQTGSVLQLTAATGLFYALQSGIGPVGKYFTKFDGFVDKWLSAIFHEDSIAWYLESHVNFESMWQELEGYAFDQNSFADIWRLHIHQLEGVVGFMCLQSQNLGQKNTVSAQRAETIAKTIVEQATVAATNFEAVFAQKNNSSVSGLITEYQENINKSIEHFKFIEMFRAA